MFIRLFACSSLVLALMTACGDDTVDSGAGDDRADAGTDPGDDTGDGGVMAESATIFALGRDGSAGIASTISVPALEVTRDVVSGVASSDAVVRKDGSRLYVINRFSFNNVTVLDAADYSLIAQFSTGNDSNPQDLAVVGDSLYIAAFGASSLLIVDAGNLAAGVAAEVDLSALDPDGKPNCNSVLAVDDRVYVACGLLDENFAPRGNGKIAVIDTNTNELVETLELSTPNPFGSLMLVDDASTLSPTILIPTVTDFSNPMTGCIEKITAGPTPKADGCLVDNATLGGFVGGMESIGERLWLVVTYYGDSGPVGSLHTYDLATGTYSASLSPDSQILQGLARCPTGEVVVADTAGGLRVYEDDGTEMTSAPLDLGLPPAGSMVCY